MSGFRTELSSRSQFQPYIWVKLVKNDRKNRDAKFLQVQGLLYSDKNHTGNKQYQVPISLKILKPNGVNDWFQFSIHEGRGVVDAKNVPENHAENRQCSVTGGLVKIILPQNPAENGLRVKSKSERYCRKSSNWGAIEGSQSKGWK